MAGLLDIAKQFVKLAEQLELTEESAKGLLHEDYSQWELPNLLNKAGQRSDRADSFRRMKLAKQIMASQKYEITSATESRNTVVLEAKWVGTMAIDAGPLKSGQELRAFFCMIFEFREGLIYRVRNYDCFEPFEKP